MNKYYKYRPNVYLAQCSEEYKKGDVITVASSKGKQYEHIVHNLIGSKGGHFYYSITRADGYNAQTKIAKKIEQRHEWMKLAEQRKQSHYENAERDHAFLSLGEPIKVGHHSEAKHRKAFARKDAYHRKFSQENEKIEHHKERAEALAKRANDINLSMPESLAFFTQLLEEAQVRHQGLKDGTIERAYSREVSTALSEVKELTKKVDLAQKLWG